MKALIAPGPSHNGHRTHAKPGAEPDRAPKVKPGADGWHRLGRGGNVA
jgi:hypothetical protein